MVTHSSTNRARRRTTSLMETSALQLRQTVTISASFAWSEVGYGAWWWCNDWWDFYYDWIDMRLSLLYVTYIQSTSIIQPPNLCRHRVQIYVRFLAGAPLLMCKYTRTAKECKRRHSRTKNCALRILPLSWLVLVDYYRLSVSTFQFFYLK